MLGWIWQNLQFCYENRTPGPDPAKGGMSMGNVVEVDLEKKSQSAQPILTSLVGTRGTCSLPKTRREIQAPADSMSCKCQK